MIHRLAVLLIVGFWLAMTALLVVRELYPEATNLNQVPLSYVGQLCFQHKQPSDLIIYNSGKDVGYFHFEPKVSKNGRNRSLELHGNFTLQFVGNKQRLNWNTSLELDGAGEITQVKLDIGINEPGQEPTRHLNLRVDNVAQQATYSLRVDGVQFAETTISLDKAGMAKVFERLGLDEVLLRQVELTHQNASAKFDAQESSTSLNGEKISTYLVSMKVGDQTMFEAHVSPLGQILRASVPLLNFRLAPKDVTP